MSNKRLIVAGVVTLLLSVMPASAVIRLAPPLGEHMVLQQGVPVPIWGTGAPGGDTVRVSFHGQNVTAHSDWAGRWMVVLAPMKSGGPYQMLIEVGGMGPVVPSSAANSRGGAELNDVVVGEVREVPQVDDTKLGATAGSPSQSLGSPPAWIRIYHLYATEGRWTLALPGKACNYSLASFVFARELYNQYHVPIGVIDSSPRVASSLNR